MEPFWWNNLVKQQTLVKNITLKYCLPFRSVKPMEKFISWGAGMEGGLGKGADSVSASKLCEKTNEEQVIWKTNMEAIF